MASTKLLNIKLWQNFSYDKVHNVINNIKTLKSIYYLTTLKKNKCIINYLLPIIIIYLNII